MANELVVQERPGASVSDGREGRKRGTIVGNADVRGLILGVSIRSRHSDRAGVHENRGHNVHLAGRRGAGEFDLVFGSVLVKGNEG